MKKIAQILVATAIAAVPFFVSNSAFADGTGTCQIGYTGPNSNNECTLTSTFTCTVNNENNFDIQNENDQTVASGTATVADNTSGGSATSGSATNSNGTTINVSINNGSSGKLCSVVKTVPATPTPVTPTTPATPSMPVTPQAVTPSVTPGRGALSPAVVKQTVAAPQVATPTVLPNTSGDTFATSLITITGLLGVATFVTRLVVASYGRFKS